MRHRLGITLLAALLVALFAGSPGVVRADEKPEPAAESKTEKTDETKSMSEQFPPRDGTEQIALTPKGGVKMTLVPTRLRAPAARYVSPPKSRVIYDLKVMDPPKPKMPSRRAQGMGYATVKTPLARFRTDDTEPLTPGLSSSFEAMDFDTNPSLAQGRLFIPPDPQGAAGIDHLVAVTNVVVQFYQKNGTLDFENSLLNFFSTAGPVTYTFDPRVIYDQYADRWIVTTAEQTDTAGGSAENTARLFVAVSDDGDPNGSWTVAQINAVRDIGGDTWADFPALAVDEEAIYITTNHFWFFSNPSGAQYQGVRLWILEKGIGTGGIYDPSGALSVNVFNPYIGEANVLTAAPAHVFGTAPAGSGTIILGYDGLSNGTEFLQTVRVDNPLGSPVFSFQQVAVADIEDFSSYPLAPQDGSSELIATNNRRALKAVWRDDTLWGVATIGSASGATPDAGQVSAYWFKLNTANPSSYFTAAHGRIGGEDIAPQTHTFFPSIAANANGVAAVGFAATASTIFPGAYYMQITPEDTTGPSRILREGVDFYFRRFGGPTNRWGDYSGMAVDPVDDCFWVYNEYASTRGTVTNGQDGRWATVFGNFCPTDCGDGIIETPGEECDDGNDVNDDSCNNLCIANFCGDGTINNNEECDDGNQAENDDCRNDCTIPFCGDLTLDVGRGETCEPPGTPSGALGYDCRDDCTVCGDGVRNSDEQCDDGNVDDGDLCNNSCTINVCSPGEIDLRLSVGPTTIDWDSAGVPFFYDLLSGIIFQMRADGGVLQGQCLSNNLQLPTATDPRADPPPGFGYYYLVRAQAQCGSGDYGTDSFDVARVPWPNDCQ